MHKKLRQQNKQIKANFDSVSHVVFCRPSQIADMENDRIRFRLTPDGNLTVDAMMSLPSIKSIQIHPYTG